MYEMLKDINRECAIIIVSHDLAEISKYAKHIACVNHSIHYHDSAHIPEEELEKHFLDME